MVAHLHMTRPNYAKVIKATAPKVALMEVTHLSRSRDFWSYDILTNEKNIQFSQKLLDIKFDGKNTEINDLFFRFKIYMINAASWNELKLVGGYGSFFTGMTDQREIKLFSKIFSSFLKNKRGRHLNLSLHL